MIFQKNVFHVVFCYSNWPNFIVWLPQFLDILGNMCITTATSYCDVINFEINLILLIKPFFYKTKNLIILRTTRSFRSFSWQKLSQTWECAYSILKLRMRSSPSENMLHLESFSIFYSWDDDLVQRELVVSIKMFAYYCTARSFRYQVIVHFSGMQQFFLKNTFNQNKKIYLFAFLFSLGLFS